MKKTLVLVDRDGTLIYDNKYHLGSTGDWDSKIKILPKVIGGIKVLKRMKNTSVYMITNQPGVIIKDFPLLTEKRAHEVCKKVLQRLKAKGAKLNGYFLCAHASPSYVKKNKNRNFYKKGVCNCTCIKPGLGMVFSALKHERVTKNNSNIYVIGDRAADVKTALNVKGTGILVPFMNEPQEKLKTKEIRNKNVYIAKDFLDAANFIVKKTANRS